jgi:hypothetical protein
MNILLGWNVMSLSWFIPLYLQLYADPGGSAMMEAVRTSETSVNFNVTTRRYNPEDSTLLTD